MIDVVLKIGLAAFFLNLAYELLHSLLYTTCWEAPLNRYVYLILKAALFDGVIIAIVYGLSWFLPFGRMMFFVVVLLAFAWFWEVYSLRKGKWQYTQRMPLLLGVGLTPLVQLAACGILSLYLVFYLC